MAQQFWDAALPLIRVTEAHPFLVAMVDSTLPLANFQYYVVQDAIYLHDFVDCLRRLARNPQATREDAAQLNDLANGAEEDELSLHSSFFGKWGIDASDAKPMPNTLLYTSHMLRVVTTGDYAEGLAILLPCFWVYMHVGKCMLRLRDKLGDSVERVPQFDAWIDMYAGDEFEQQVRSYIDIVDRVANEASEETRGKMREHFLMSCRLEHMFWDQANELLQWPQIAPVALTSTGNEGIEDENRA